jgi:hypothetical protein
MANLQPLSPQGYNITEAPVNTNPFYEEPSGGGNVPAGGSPGQVLVKKTAADYDTEWQTPDGVTNAQLNELEDTLRADIDAETKARQTQDTALSGQIADNTAAITAEQTARQDADSALQQSINAEQQTRQAQDTALSGQIAANAAAVEQETTNRQNADNALSQRVTAVEQQVKDLNIPDVSGLTAEVEQLQGQMTLFENDLNAEEKARAAADTQLQQGLEAEQTARNAAIQEQNTAIQQNADAIAAEQIARQQADTAFQQAIDGKTGLPAGGTEGQVLTKTSGTDYAAEWQDPTGGGSLPDPSSAGQVLTAGEDLTPEWKTPATVHEMPAGGTAGQVLTKKTGTDYDTEWKTPSGGGGGENPLPTGGTTGQVLTKASNTDYDVEWTTPQSGGGGGVTREAYGAQVKANPGAAYWNGDTSASSLYKTFTAFQSDMADVKFCELQIVESTKEETFTAFFDPATLAATQGNTLLVPFGLGLGWLLTAGATGISFKARCLEAVKPTTTLQYKINWFNYK